MKIVFLSNYYNHHQSALSERLNLLSRGQFAFIKTTEIGEERVALGWKTDEPDYVISYGAAPERCDRLISDADMVLYGAAPVELIKPRLAGNKPVFKYSERIFKNFKAKITLPLRIFKYRRDYGNRNNVYLMCASAYAAADYASALAFRGRAFRWGYFPRTMTYGAQLQESKDPRSILWTGRFADWKHPETPVLLAEKLTCAGIDFKMKMVGRGERLQSVRRLAEERGVSGKIEFPGAMSPDAVRREMEKARVYIATSDFNEGWGAVINEAMNSGCAVVASHAMGSVPYLIKHGTNGFIYKSGDTDGLFEKVSRLLVRPDEAKKLGENAYASIAGEWNAETAAERLAAMGEAALKGESMPIYDSGPCSAAPLLTNRFTYEK